MSSAFKKSLTDSKQRKHRGALNYSVQVIYIKFSTAYLIFLLKTFTNNQFLAEKLLIRFEFFVNIKNLFSINVKK